MDANDAGGRNSGDCTLILTEGDSAKSLVVGGLSVAGRDKFGVFPLRQAQFPQAAQTNCCSLNYLAGFEKAHVKVTAIILYFRDHILFGA